MPDQRRSVDQFFSLQLDGIDSGVVHSIAGGGIAADVISQQIGPDYFARKRIGAVRYEEIAVEVDLSLHSSVYTWIGQALTGHPRRVDGAIVTGDQKQSARSSREFRGALLTEVAFPAMDAASTESAFIGVRFAPELIRAGTAAPAPSKRAISKGRNWNRAGFRLAIDGLDCTKVSKIDGFTVKNVVVANSGGEQREPIQLATRLEFSNLRVSLAESSAPTWAAWSDDFLVNGKNDDGNERKGTLTFLAPDFKQVLGTVRFVNLGIFQFGPERLAAGETAASVSAGLYCERIEFVVPASS